MKKIIFPILALSLIAGSSCQEKIDIEKEKEAIKAVIEQTSAAYHEADYDQIINNWIHEPYVLASNASKDDQWHFRGWQKIDEAVKKYASNLDSIQQAGNWEYVSFENYDYTIRVYQQCAWASFYSKYIYTWQEANYDKESLQVVFLERHEDEWKIIYFDVVDLYSYEKAKEKSVEEESETKD